MELAFVADAQTGGQHQHHAKRDPGRPQAARNEMMDPGSPEIGAVQPAIEFFRALRRARDHGWRWRVPSHRR